MPFLFPNFDDKDFSTNNKAYSFFCILLEEAGIPTLAGRRDLLSKNLFNDIAITKDHKLVNLLPKRSTNSHQLRNRRVFDTPVCSTNRFKNSFIIDNSLNYIA